MPELPEVETARRTLERWVAGQTIVRARAEPSRLLRDLSARSFARQLRGRRVEQVLRRGKQLLLELDDRSALGIHLGMTGKVLGRAPDAPAPAYTRARLELEDGRIHFISRRLFGRLVVGTAEEVRSETGWARLGPDPLTDGLTPAGLRAALGQSRQAIKVRLMDQARLAGLGNIQAMEALFRARIDPRKAVNALERSEHDRLARAIHRGISHTLKHLDPIQARYLAEGGDQVNPFLIYGREDEPCPRCQTPLERFMLGGRVTFACPACQPSEEGIEKRKAENGKGRTSSIESTPKRSIRRRSKPRATPPVSGSRSTASRKSSSRG